MIMEVIYIMVNSKNLYIKSAIYGSTLSILSLSALNFYLPSHSIIKSGEQPFHQFIYIN